MPVKDWFSLTAIQAESRRTTAVAAALVSFWAISKLTRLMVGPGALATFIVCVDDIVLAVVFLSYTVRLLYDIYRELTRDGNANFVLVA